MGRFQVGEVAILETIPEILKKDLAICKIHEGAVCKILDIIGDGKTLVIGNEKWDCSQEVDVMKRAKIKPPEKYDAYNGKAIRVNTLFLGKIYR